MTAIPRSRAAERPDAKDFPSRPRRRGGARCKGAFAVAAAALVGYAGIAGACFASEAEPVPQRAVALVIGNATYEHAAPLANPGNDAAAMAAALARLGFEVRHLEDAGYVDMHQGLLELSQVSRSAEAAVAFYAGHGHAVDGRNYLIPVDALGPALEAVGDDHALDPGHHVTEGNLGLIPTTWLLRSVAGASKLRLVVLDAHVPAPWEPAGGTIVAQAAAVGTEPDDGTESHSPYTEALLRYLEEPALELGMLFGKVREDVRRATNGRQEPVVYGWPGWDMSLGSLSGQAPEAAPPAPTGEAPVR